MNSMLFPTFDEYLYGYPEDPDEDSDLYEIEQESKFELEHDGE